MVDEKFHSYVFGSLNPRTSLHCYFAAKVGAVHVGTRSQQKCWVGRVLTHWLRLRAPVGGIILFLGRQELCASLSVFGVRKKVEFWTLYYVEEFQT